MKKGRRSNYGPYCDGFHYDSDIDSAFARIRSMCAERSIYSDISTPQKIECRASNAIAKYDTSDCSLGKQAYLAIRGQSILT